MTTQRGHRSCRPTHDPRPHPAAPVGHPVDLATAQPPSHDDDQVEADLPLAQHDLCQPRGPGSNLGQTTRRCAHGGRPRRPRPSQPCRLPAPPPRPTTSFRRTQRTPETGHLDTQTAAPDTDHLDRPRGHRTLAPDTGQERGHGDDSTAGVRTSLAATPSDRTMRRPTVFALAHYQPTPRPLRGPRGAPAHCCPETRIPGC